MLPKIQHPTFEIEVPSTGQKINIRPFLVKEEKILLLAKESGELSDMLKAILQIINNCVESADFNIDSLKMFDVDYIFLKLRCISQGDKLTLAFTADPKSDCEKCSKPKDVEIDLNKVSISKGKKITGLTDNKLKISDTMGVVLQYPSPKDMIKHKIDAKDSIDSSLKLIWCHVDYIYDGDKIYKASDMKLEEGVEFIENFDINMFKKIENFISGSPKITYDIEYKCPQCSKDIKYTIEGSENFLE